MPSHTDGKPSRVIVGGPDGVGDSWVSCVCVKVHDEIVRFANGITILYVGMFVAVCIVCLGRCTVH